MLVFASSHGFISQRVSEEEDINLPKVPLTFICTIPVKCLPRLDDEVTGDKIGMVELV